MLVQGGKTVGANDDSDIPQHGQLTLICVSI